MAKMEEEKKEISKPAPLWCRVFVDGETDNATHLFKSRQDAESFIVSIKIEQPDSEIEIEESAFMASGEYIIGDLKPILEKKVWGKVIQPIKDGNTGGVFLLNDGTPFAIFKTYSGNGIFNDDLENKYIVQNETIGVFPVKASGASDEDLDNYHDYIGSVINFPEAPIEACFEEGYDPPESTLWIGQLLIHTDEEFRTPINQAESGKPPRELVLLLHNVLCDFWRFTPFANEPIPRCQISENDDGSVNFSYQLMSGGAKDGQLSLFYTVDFRGLAICRETGEELNLNEDQILGGVVATIIQDIYGNYDIQKASRDFYLWLGDKEEIQ